jgi:hypothetical protein
MVETLPGFSFPKKSFAGFRQPYFWSSSGKILPSKKQTLFSFFFFFLNQNQNKTSGFWDFENFQKI